MSKANRRILAISLAVAAAGLLAASLKLPLWHMRMEAPQYRDDEALRVHVFASSMSGDLGEINVLNQYIGVHVPEVLPQSRWLPVTLAAAAGLGILTSVLPGRIRSAGLVFAALALSGAVGIAVLQAKQQMHDIGHKRDAHTKMARVQDFTPPFLGTARIAQFTVSSWLGAGAYLIGAAIALQAGAAFAGRERQNLGRKRAEQAPITSFKNSEALA